MEPRTRALLGLAALSIVAPIAGVGGVPACGATDVPASSLAAGATRAAADGEALPRSDRLRLVTRDDPRLGRVSRGTYTVFENRAAASGRTLDLDVVVLRALGEPVA